MIKAIFFDWFHTLARYDPPREKLHSQLLHEFGIEVSPSDLMPALMVADRYFFTESARFSPNKRSPEAQAELYLHYTDIMLNEVGVKVDKVLITQMLQEWPRVFSGAKFTLFDDVLPTLKILKERRLTLGLLTNATKEAISIYRTLGLESHLDFVVTSEEAGVDKPGPEIFLTALEKAGVTASEAVHVGDQYDLDVAGARGVGISPILIDRYNLYPEVSDCPRISTLPEVTSYL